MIMAGSSAHRCRLNGSSRSVLRSNTAEGGRESALTLLPMNWSGNVRCSGVDGGGQRIRCAPTLKVLRNNWFSLMFVFIGRFGLACVAAAPHTGVFDWYYGIGRKT